MLVPSLSNAPTDSTLGVQLIFPELDGTGLELKGCVVAVIGTPWEIGFSERAGERPETRTRTGIDEHETEHQRRQPVRARRMLPQPCAGGRCRPACCSPRQARGVGEEALDRILAHLLRLVSGSFGLQLVVDLRLLHLNSAFTAMPS